MLSYSVTGLKIYVIYKGTNSSGKSNQDICSGKDAPLKIHIFLKVISKNK